MYKLINKKNLLKQKKTLTLSIFLVIYLTPTTNAALNNYTPERWCLYNSNYNPRSRTNNRKWFYFRIKEKHIKEHLESLKELHKNHPKAFIALDRKRIIQRRYNISNDCLLVLQKYNLVNYNGRPYRFIQKLLQL